MTYNPDKPIHPGYAIAVALSREGMTQKNLSQRTGLSEKHISQIINGDASITIDTALLLENVLGGTASFWTNLEKDYQETLARQERASLIEKEMGLVSRFPYDELVSKGYVESTVSVEEKIKNLWKFFGVNSLSFVQKTESIAFRKKNTVEDKSESIAAWLRCGELEFKKQDLPKYSKAKLKKSLDRIKLLTLQKSKKALKELKLILNESGVALVYVTHFTNTRVSGAVRWIGDHPIIQLSTYYKWSDIFWFNLFHEIGHLLLHSKKEKFIEYDKSDNPILSDKEKEADEFAGNELIPYKKYLKFCEKDFSEKRIVVFARSLGIHPGIVAGRLCHDGKAEWNEMSDLRSKIDDNDLI